MFFSRLSVALIFLAVAICVGCGDGRPGRVPVSGRVLIDGEPLEHGNIRFHPPGQRAASAKLGPGGRFTLSTYEFGDGCVTGVHAVSILGTEVLNAQARKWHAPPKYSGPASSKLSYEVTGPTDSAEFNLSWEGKEPYIERMAGGE